MYVILHISDLHRTGGDRISNQELVSSLVTDFVRTSRESPRVERPNAIVVSGDLVEGLPFGSEAYPEGLTRQYQEVADLLADLSDEFLSGDRSQLVIVPGNHDVDWNGVRDSFEVEEQDPSNRLRSIEEMETGYRWSWKDRQVFRIANQKRYEARFDYFNQMYREFYRDARLDHPVDPERPWNLFNLDGGNIVVAAFNSCVINDCFSDLGHIRSRDLADCHLEMRRRAKPACLPISVWHHGVAGPQLASDYVGPEVIKQMIDKGFRLGFHGHLHDSTYYPVDLFVSTKETMAVIGAGSLCSGPKALPHGVNRRYNVVHIDQDQGTGQVHVREMNQPTIWGPGQLAESGGKSYVDITWTTSSLHMVDQSRSGGPVTAKSDDVEHLVRTGRWKEARDMLLTDTALSQAYKRRLLAKVYEEGEQWLDLMRLLDPPRNEDEVATFVAAAERSGHLTNALEMLARAKDSGEISQALIVDLDRRIQARLRFGR